MLKGQLSFKNIGRSLDWFWSKYSLPRNIITKNTTLSKTDRYF